MAVPTQGIGEDEASSAIQEENAMPIVTIQFFGFLRVRVGLGVAFTDVFSATAARMSALSDFSSILSPS